jgi:hypothetical protein
MKFDAKVLEVLKNFNTINQSLLFKAGNVISTVSPGKTILARATLDIDIPREFAVYELSKFIGALSLVPECEVEFGEHQLVIKGNGSRLKYSYAAPAMITASTYKELTVERPVAKFDLPYATLNSIVRAASVLELPDIAIKGEEGKISIIAFNAKDNTSNDYRVDMGTCDDDFSIALTVESFKLLNRDYVVTVPNSSSFVEFKSADITYWTAASTV